MAQRRTWRRSRAAEPLSPQAMRALTLSALEGGQCSSRRDDPYAVALTLPALDVTASPPSSFARPVKHSARRSVRSLPPTYARSEFGDDDRTGQHLSSGNPASQTLPLPRKVRVRRSLATSIAVEDWSSWDGLPATSRPPPGSSLPTPNMTTLRAPLSPRLASADSRLSHAHEWQQMSLMMMQQQQRRLRLQRLANKPGDAIKKLPKEILDMIIEELRRVHLDGASANMTCSTCWMKDVCSLSLTNHQWAASAQPKLYDTIILLGSDSTNHMKKLKMKRGMRLKLLRRTLRANPVLAGYVKGLKVPNITTSTSTAAKEVEKYIDLVATVVMACPNLEKLLDFYIPHDAGYSKLVHATTTRTKLTEYVWNFAAQGEQAPRREKHGAFASRHTNLTSLKTLVLHCAKGGMFDSSVIIPTLRKLPALEHLALSGLPSLPPNILSSVPPLKSLYIANIPESPHYDASSFMITPALSSFITTTSSANLRSLSLINTDLDSLPVLARLFKSLHCLERFTFQQDNPPALPIGINISVYPYLTSSSIIYLHWDILMQNDTHRSSDATRILARSIKADGFPALRRLRAPCDYDGLLQCVCRPTPRIYMPHHYVTARRKIISSGGSKDSGIGLTPAEESLVTVVGQTDDGDDDDKPHTRSLLAARKAAQKRIDLARLRPRFSVVCEDWQNSRRAVRRDTYEIAGFVGIVSSHVTYDLEPDIEDDDEALMTVEGLVRGSETRATTTEKCTGSWNYRVHSPGHVERFKWRSVGVEKLFA